ncbi:CAP domain-containing protein [Devosia sp. CN2-171]|uniref:CAP domain-containing protein n=1 Tax=Devosia sp. CN2-171 TaxID=3400909 RepID=UPI003BF7B9F5
MQTSKIENAVLCLVNAERGNLPPLVRYRSLGAIGIPLARAASKHVTAAIALKWWGRVTPGKDCRPIRDNPRLCDPHINPQTGSTPGSRAEAEGYGRNCRESYVAENTYAGWGGNKASPRAAVEWWMNSQLHKATILDPKYRELYTIVTLGSADPDAGSVSPAASYVQMFGVCTK